MARVKGSKQENLVVVPHTPFQGLINRVLVIVVIIAAATAGYWYGQNQGFKIRDKAVALVEQLQDSFKDNTLRLQEAKLRVATLEKGSEVDQKANEDIRQIVKGLKDQVASLQEEVALYKGIMTPSLSVGGLTIQELSIDPTADPRRYRLKIMLTQVGENKSFVQGFAGVSVIGVQEGKKVALLFKDLSDQITTTDIRFRYRYFQDIKGEIKFPDNFSPEQIYVVAQSSGRNASRVEKYFDWGPLETNINVEQ